MVQPLARCVKPEFEEVFIEMVLETKAKVGEDVLVYTGGTGKHKHPEK